LRNNGRRRNDGQTTDPQGNSKELHLKIISIEDLIKYRKKNEKLVERHGSASLPTKFGDFRIYSYVDQINEDEHVPW